MSQPYTKYPLPAALAEGWDLKEAATWDPAKSTDAYAYCHTTVLLTLTPTPRAWISLTDVLPTPTLTTSTDDFDTCARPFRLRDLRLRDLRLRDPSPVSNHASAPPNIYRGTVAVLSCIKPSMCLAVKILLNIVIHYGAGTCSYANV